MKFCNVHVTKENCECNNNNNNDKNRILAGKKRRRNLAHPACQKQLAATVPNIFWKQTDGTWKFWRETNEFFGRFQHQVLHFQLLNFASMTYTFIFQIFLPDSLLFTVEILPKEIKTKSARRLSNFIS